MSGRRRTRRRRGQEEEGPEQGEEDQVKEFRAAVDDDGWSEQP